MSYLLPATLLVILAIAATAWPLWDRRAGWQNPLVLGSMAAMIAVPLLLWAYDYYVDYQGPAQEWAKLQQQWQGQEQRLFSDASAWQNLDSPKQLQDQLRVMQAFLQRQGLQDAQGLAILGRGYQILGQTTLATQALQEAYLLSPNQPQVALDYAEQLVATNQGQLTPKARQLLDYVLSQDPQQQKALLLLGLGTLRAGDGATALPLLKRLQAQRDKNSQGYALLAGAIAQAEAQINANKTQPKTTEPPSTRVDVTVTIADDLKQKIEPQWTLFVFARLKDGIRLPLAVYRGNASHWPQQITLSTASAMQPSHRLQAGQTVVITARLSPTGQALPSTGDWQGVSSPIELTDGVSQIQITIDQPVANNPVSP